MIYTDANSIVMYISFDESSSPHTTCHFLASVCKMFPIQILCVIEPGGSASFLRYFHSIGRLSYAHLMGVINLI